MNISQAALDAFWKAYDKETWNGTSGEVMETTHKDKCLKVGIEAAAKTDGIVWESK